MENKSKKYYAGGSAHGNETSNGFSNDWFVYVFDSKKSRNYYVENSKNISVKPIVKSQVTAHLKSHDYNIKPFSGEFWGIVPCLYDYTTENISGCIGSVEIVEDNTQFETLY